MAHRRYDETAHRRYDEESKRVLGFRVDSVPQVDVEFFRALVHPVRSVRAWRRRRRRGPYLD